MQQEDESVDVIIINGSLLPAIFELLDSYCHSCGMISLDHDTTGEGTKT